MAVTSITKILSVTPNVSRYGQDGFVTKAIADGDEVSNWSAESEPKFKEGDVVYTWFEDQYNRGAFKRIKDVDNS